MYLISYDIASNRLRTKLAKKLLNYGKRVQYSVFECDINRIVFRKCYEEMMELIDGQSEVSIRCYVIDKTAQGKMILLGDPEYILSDIAEDVIFI